MTQSLGQPCEFYLCHSPKPTLASSVLRFLCGPTGLRGAPGVRHRPGQEPGGHQPVQIPPRDSDPQELFLGPKGILCIQNLLGKEISTGAQVKFLGGRVASAGANARAVVFARCPAATSPTVPTCRRWRSSIPSASRTVSNPATVSGTGVR